MAMNVPHHHSHSRRQQRQRRRCEAEALPFYGPRWLLTRHLATGHRWREVTTMHCRVQVSHGTSLDHDLRALGPCADHSSAVLQTLFQTKPVPIVCKIQTQTQTHLQHIHISGQLICASYNQIYRLWENKSAVVLLLEAYPLLVLSHCRQSTQEPLK